MRKSCNVNSLLNPYSDKSYDCLDETHTSTPPVPSARSTEHPYNERIFKDATSSFCLSYSSHLPSATRDLHLLLSTAPFHLLTEVFWPLLPDSHFPNNVCHNHPSIYFTLKQTSFPCSSNHLSSLSLHCNVSFYLLVLSKRAGKTVTKSDCNYVLSVRLSFYMNRTNPTVGIFLKFHN
jgi:hypothetical protein